MTAVGVNTQQTLRQQANVTVIMMCALALFYGLTFLTHVDRPAYLLGMAAALTVAYGIYAEVRGQFSGPFLGVGTRGVNALLFALNTALLFLSLFWMNVVDRHYPTDTTWRVIQVDKDGVPIDPAFHCR
jgi:hypothetical protein